MKCGIFRSVTVEPVLFLFMFAGGLLWPTMRAVVYQKVCLSNYNATICHEVDNGNHSMEENVVQSQASHWYMAETLCFDIPSILVSIFYGALSDNVSRKMALLLPMIGQVISASNYLVCVIFFDIPVGVILLGPLCSGLFGGWVVCCMAAFSLISDITPTHSRTSRIAIAESMISLSIALSLFAGGALLDRTNFTCVVALALCLYILAVIYIVIFIKDPPKVGETGTPRQTCTFLCRPERLKQTLKVVVKKRPHGKRTYLLVIFLILALVNLATNGKIIHNIPPGDIPCLPTVR